MKDFFIADAPRFEGQSVTSFFLISAFALRDRKPSGQYLALTLADKSGQFEARMWEDFADAVATCGSGCYVKVQGTVSKYQGKFQITLTKLRLAAEAEVDTADFVPTSIYDIPTMERELRGYVLSFRNPHLKRLVFAFLDDPKIGPAFLAAPAAKRLHHAWLGGLLEHVLCLVRVCLATAPFYPEVDPDLLVTGAILHDIGKVRELSWDTSFDYTLEGQLIGHISIAQGLLHEKIAQLDAEASAPPPSPSVISDEGTMTGTSADLGSSSDLQPLLSGSSSDPQPLLSGSSSDPQHSSAGSSSRLQPLSSGSSRDPQPTSAGSSSGLQAAEIASRSDGALAPELFASGNEKTLSIDEVSPQENAHHEPFPPKLRLLLEHMILSHHGKLEFGSPKLPMTPEAMLLSALDDLEAKFQTLRNEFAAAQSAGKSSAEVTDWVRSMERPLFNSQAWLTSEGK